MLSSFRSIAWGLAIYCVLAYWVYPSIWGVREPERMAAFIPIAGEANFSQSRVHVFTPKDCTRAEAARAQTLAHALRAAGLRVTETDSVQWTFASQAEAEAARLAFGEIYGNPGPAVFFKGHGIANPGVEQVLELAGKLRPD